MLVSNRKGVLCINIHFISYHILVPWHLMTRRTGERRPTCFLILSIHKVMYVHHARRGYPSALEFRLLRQQLGALRMLAQTFKPPVRSHRKFTSLTRQKLPCRGSRCRAHPRLASRLPIGSHHSTTTAALLRRQADAAANGKLSARYLTDDYIIQQRLVRGPPSRRIDHFYRKHEWRTTTFV